MTELDASGQLLTLDQVAERCQLGRRTIERLVSRGELPALKVGGSTRVDPSELDRWLYADPADPLRPVEDPAERTAPASSSSRSAVEAVPLAGPEPE